MILASCTCALAIGFVVEPLPGAGFGVLVLSPSLHELLLIPREVARPLLNDAFSKHHLLYWKNATLTPRDEIQIMKLLPWNLAVADNPSLLYG